MKFIECYRPPAITRTNWYVADWYDNPIHVFDTKLEAIEWAQSQPEPVHPYGIVVAANVDWLHYGSCARLEVSKTRTIVDHRTKTKLSKTKLVNGRLQHAD